MVNTKVQLQQGTTKIQQGASTTAMGISTVAQSAAAQGMQAAAQGMQMAAQNLRSGATTMNTGVRSGTLNARTWAAPRLETAANYTTASLAPAISDAVIKNLAPRVSAALLTTARQVNPEPVKQRSGLRSTLTWTALGAAVLAAAGAVGTLAWRRYRDAMDADTEPDMTGTGTTPGAASKENLPPNPASPADVTTPTAGQSRSAGSSKSNW